MEEAVLSVQLGRCIIPSIILVVGAMSVVHNAGGGKDAQFVVHYILWTQQ